MPVGDDLDIARTVSKGPQLITHLPRAHDDALRSFIELPDNTYQYSTLGRSRQKDDCMVCDCQYEYGADPPEVACGHGSDCINRLTQVECLEDECRCRSHCQNQRFQRKQHADIEIVLTEKKGYGLRAATDLLPDAFIYEYIGQVVNQPTFLKRMREYADEGVKHFYFMMLQKEEYIDATKKGGIGRFANHSCNPNCYVAKWVVGPRVRMGIFAKRKILEGEELTFNYNVDRYGHDAQPCYCGEPNCVGFIGGKTQTDLAGMDDLYLDALGIVDDVEKLNLKGTKKKSSRKLDEDYMPILRAVDESEVPKVVAALRQATHGRIVQKLLTRIRMTDDEEVQRRLMRMHGYNIMAGILEDFSEDEELVFLALESMSLWSLQTRNKVEDAHLEELVTKYVESENEKLRNLANELLPRWAALPTAYRIPKRAWKPTDEGGEPSNPNHSRPATSVATPTSPRPSKRIRLDEEIPVSAIAFQPMGFKFSGPSPLARTSSASTPRPTPALATATQPAALPQPIRAELAAIIAQAAAAATTVTISSETTTPSHMAKRSHRPSNRPSDTSRSKAGDATSREKRMSRLVSETVVQCMSRHIAKHSMQLEREDFKRHAKDLTNLIVEKEKRSSNYSTAKLDKLSDEKQTKMRKFVKAYLAKLHHRAKTRIARTPLTLHESSGTPEDGNDSTVVLNGGTMGLSTSLTPDEPPPNDDVPYSSDEENEAQDMGLANSRSPSSL
ncbi:SET domain-containing protein [Calocera viscosa TUFC12733]|uniref:Histone-lysine N-methyltransferase, H3 lysine-36 specific n=1 Tax=Calocera viscosa (strain TUFC12733) TaxID=1330018 RepID=A0A167N9Y3_CALVF|nr:SET domain-containing protein [Calocera viscosa TUFC12733]